MLVRREAEHLMHDFRAEIGLAARKKLLEERLRVAKRTVGAAGDDSEGVMIGADAFAAGDFGKRRFDFVKRDPGEFKALATRQDGDRDLVFLGRGEEEFDVLGGSSNVFKTR